MVNGRALESSYHSQRGTYKSTIEILDLAKFGDRVAIKLINEFIFNLAVGIKAITTILDPAEFVLGGGIGAREDVRKMATDQLANLMIDPPILRTSALGTRAGLVGAMSLALSEIRTRAVTGMQSGATP